MSLSRNELKALRYIEATLTNMESSSRHRYTSRGIQNESLWHWLRRSVGPAMILLSIVCLSLSLGSKRGIAEQPDHMNGQSCEQMSVDACLALDVQDREPVWRSEVFEESVGIVYCWTRVIGVTDSTTITHIWVHDTTEMARVPLRVGSPSWRTWSFKTIPPWAKGEWTVRLANAEGSVIDSLRFEVLSEAQMWNAPLEPPGYTSRRQGDHQPDDVR